MNAINHLLKTPNHFALVGLEARYEIDESLVSARHAELKRLLEPDGALADAAPADRTALADRIDAAARCLGDPESRAEYLLSLTADPAEKQFSGLPGRSQDAIANLRSRFNEAGHWDDRDALAALRPDLEHARTQHLGHVAALFRALAGHDNPIVQRQRRRDLRAELNAVAQLRKMIERT